MKKNAHPVGLIVLATLLCLLASPLWAGTLPNGFAELRIAEGLDGTTIHYAPDGRIFVTQKKGLISIIKNGALVATPFLDIIDDVDNNNERGLQNMVLDPNFATNGYVYVYYCVAGENHNRVSRFTATGDHTDHSSEVVILNLEPLASNIHNGGSMFFKDGKLFITTGEGSNATLAQSFSSLLGKVLRINSDGSIPTDNPFYGALSGNYRMIYALGFRNPYRASVQPGTGRVFINDVGNSSFEEINELFAGKNYGWPLIEGNITSQTPPANYQNPVYAYPHSMGCCVGGGAFYNPTTANFPNAYVGKYFFGDYCGNYIKVLDPNTGTVVETFATNVNRPISFTIGEDGTFYYLARGGLGGGSKDANTQSCCAEVWKVNFTNNGFPSISAQPESQTVPIDGTATFVVGASGNAPLMIQWQRNGVNIPGATSYIYEIASAQVSDNNAQFRAVVSNGLGSVTSQTVLLKVDNNMAPTPTIILPTVGSTYIAGSTITFSGSATDLEDGTIPPEGLTWEIIFHHGTHTHPGLPPTSGISTGTFTLGNSETAANVWYRVYLTATDSFGESTTVYRDIQPVLSTLTLATSTPGLKLFLDGAEVTSPIASPGVAGVLREISAPSPQTLNGITYQLVNWSDGGAPDHVVTTPNISSTITAYYLPLFLEAENATLSGVTKKAAYAGFSGTGYADYTNAAADYIEWTFSLPAAGNYNLDFKYANGTTKDRPLNLIVNGATIQTNKPFPPTGLWSDWGTATSAVTLNAGSNTVRLVANGLNGGNIDYLLVSPNGPITPTVAAPAIAPSGGTFATSQLVTISTSTSGAAIYYTTDGTTPTTSSLNYMGAFTVSSTSTVKAIAIKSGMNNSPVTTASFIINSNPNFSTMLEAESAVLSGAPVRFQFAGYTGTGYADYMNNSDDYIEWTVNVPAAGNYKLDFRYANGTTKDRPLKISTNGVVTEISKSFPSTGVWTTWAEVSSVVALNAGANTIRATDIGLSGPNMDHLTITSEGPVVPATAAPVFTPAAGSYSASVSVSITTATSGATIYYTLDGSTPTTASAVYSVPFTISSSTIVKAFAKASGMSDSPLTTAAYSISVGPAFSATLEAEVATLSGVVVKYAYPGFSGTGYGDYVANAGEYIEWVVNVPSSGSYKLDFKYANGTAKDRPLDISVNGSVVEASKAFPSTSLWSTWGTVSKTVTLMTGNNTIRATSIGLSGSNVDYVMVSSTTVPAARTVTAEAVVKAEITEGIGKEVVLYPVPANDIITIRSRENIEVNGIETLDGKVTKVGSSKKAEGEWEVNVSSFGKGLYIMNMKAGNKIVRKKFVIER